MGLFGSSALKRKIASLTEALEAAQAKIETLENTNNDLNAALGSKDESYQAAKEGRQKADKKLEKVTAKSMSNEKKLAAALAELEQVKQDLNEYRAEVLSARSESERLQAKLVRQVAPAAPVNEQNQKASQAPEPEAKLPSPEAIEKKIDRRVARLEEQLANEKNKTDEFKGRALRAEQSLRDADKKRASNAGKLDAKLRDVEHALQSERKAYKILQLQYQGLLETSRGRDEGDGLSQAPTGEASENAVAPAEAPDEAAETQVSKVSETQA